jgi:hypothetical protein
MIDPRFKKIIAQMKAREAGATTWLERNWSWIACALSFVTGLLVGRLL